MKNKPFIINIIVITIMLVLTFGGMFIKYYNDDIHTVHVEYTIYSPAGKIHKSGNYKMRGESFESFTDSHRGTNTVTINQKHNWFAYYGNQSVCIYVGTNDVIINKIEIIK